MNKKAVILSALLLFLLFQNSFAQLHSPVRKFGDVPPESFGSLVFAPDSSAGAVVLFDKGNVYFDASTSGARGFDVVFEKHCRMRLLNKNAFRVATMALSMYNKGDRAITLDNFKGASYNLEDGKVVSAKLDKSNTFKEINGDIAIEKFVFPNVKEGTIIEYSYRMVFPGYGFIPAWFFQGEFPEIWSEYQITIPGIIDYMMQNQGYHKFALDTSTVIPTNLSITLPSATGYGDTYRGTWHGNALQRTWVMQDVPALAKREPFTTTLRNHISKIEFQLVAVRAQGYEKTYRSNWDELVTELMKMPTFGEPLGDRNHWIDDELKKITEPGNTSLESARKIYYYVRDHFDYTGTESLYFSQPLKKIWEDKKGNAADINLLLTTLYQHQGFEAAPVILSTRPHGLAYEAYPLLKDYNYVITRVKAGEQYYLLDATSSNFGFGQLAELCYNGSGRIIDAMHQLVPLSPDSVTEKRNTLVVLANDSSGYVGRIYHTAGNFESVEMRQRFKRTTPEDFFEILRKGIPSYKTMEEHGIDSLNNPEVPIAWYYNMRYDFTKGTVYLNPIMHERISVSPFVNPDRHYPVEMPFCTDYTYTIHLEVPKGYAVDDLPKSLRVLLHGGDDGMFEYLVQSDGKKITVSYRMLIKKTLFPVGDYQGLREFYSRMVQKEKEEIIFKKMN